MKGSEKSYLDDIFFNDYELKIISKLNYIHSKSKEINDFIKYKDDNIESKLIDDIYYQLMNYINDGISLEKINDK